jgi:hypothetical protein
MLLKNLWDTHHRTVGLAKLYAKSSEELINVFQHVSAHMEQVIDYVGTDKFFSHFTDDKTLESLRSHLNELQANYNRRVSDNSVMCESDTIPATPVPEGSHLITTDFALLGVAFANKGPSSLSPKRTRFRPASHLLPREATLLLGPGRYLTSTTRLVTRIMWTCSWTAQRGLRSQCRIDLFLVRCIRRTLNIGPLRFLDLYASHATHYT